VYAIDFIPRSDTECRSLIVEALVVLAGRERAAALLSADGEQELASSLTK
jgi:hypothetical protein